MSDETAWCSQCETEKPKKDFHRNSARSTGVQSSCKRCQRPPTRSQITDLENRNEWLERSNKRLSRQLKLFHDALVENGITPPDLT